MLKSSKVVPSLIAGTIFVSPLFATFANAETYVVNNENTNKNASEAFLGSNSQNDFRQKTIDTKKLKNLQSFQEDKVFKALKIRHL